MTDQLDRLLDDPAVREAFAKLAGTNTQEICPECCKVELEPGRSFCDDCAKDRHRESKNDWHHRQTDYGALVANLGGKARLVHAAKRWIKGQLRKGPLDARELNRRAAEAGISTKTLKRARAELSSSHHILLEREGLARGATQWRLTRPTERASLGQLAQRSSSDREEVDGPPGPSSDHPPSSP